MNILFENLDRTLNIIHFSTTKIYCLILLKEISCLQSEPYETHKYKMQSYWS
jgi:hypothetical protein